MLVVLFHEWIHYFVAARLAVPLEDVVITPFGGCLKGEFLGVTRGKTLAITLSAPIINLIISALIFASWWLFPSLYPYTETLAYANLSVGAINLMPCYPLDGGRAIVALFQKNEKLARKIVNAASFALSVFSSALFVMSIAAKAINPSYLLMAFFLLFGCFYEEKKDYVALTLKKVLKKKKSGAVPIELVLVKNAPEYELLCMLSDNSYVVFAYEEGGVITKTETEDMFLKRIKNK